MADPITPEAFEKLVADALDGLPSWLAPYLDEVAVQIEEIGPPGEEDLYGLFDGLSLGDDPTGALPGVITLFRRPLLEDFGDDPEELAHEVRVTVVHELAHRFGFDEDRLDQLGYG